MMGRSLGSQDFSWDMVTLTLRCLLDIHIEKSGRQLDIRLLGLAEVNLSITETWRYKDFCSG